MDEPHLYKRIAETIRQQILAGSLQPGDRLPSVRETAAEWGCTIGTAQRAYQELAQQGLVTRRSGQGTRVVENLAHRGDTPLRRAMLIHRAESFLLEVLTSGFTLEEVERAVRQAMDRWRAVEQTPPRAEEKVLRFSGSHDLALAWLAGVFPEIAPGYSLQLRFLGSLGGLIALAEGQADLAGSHLWDEETGLYNEPFVRRLLPGRQMALVALAHRRIGLIVPEGNPGGLASVKDLARPGLHFANRQPGSGTRVWLDAAVREAGLSPEDIQGYQEAALTHSAVAQAVAEGQAGAGIGLEAAARSYGLGFVELTRERYDLVMSEAVFASAPIQQMLDWLKQEKARSQLAAFGGYEVEETGQVRWV